MEKIKHYFKTYPQSNECFQTTDEFIFHRAWDARAHAETLKDKRVKPWSRHEVARFELAEKEAEEAEAKAEAEALAEKEAEEAEAKAEAEAAQKEAEEAEAKVKEDKKKGKKA